MKAVIKIDVPEWQIGQEVTVFFKDTMMIKGICEAEQERKKPPETFHEFLCDGKTYSVKE